MYARPTVAWAPAIEAEREVEGACDAYLDSARAVAKADRDRLLADCFAADGARGVAYYTLADAVLDKAGANDPSTEQHLSFGRACAVARTPRRNDAVTPNERGEWSGGHSGYSGPFDLATIDL